MKIKEMIRELASSKEKLIQFSIFLVLSALVFVGMTFFKDTFQTIGWTILLIELVVLAMVAWAFAGHAVMKSLFLVGASLSFIIFLAQSYCDASNLTQSGNDALKTLLTFSIIYLGFDFFKSLYKEVTSQTKRMKEVNKGKNPWFFLVPFALFVGIFLWQLYQVMFPILSSLCIYYG
ncbi:MAG: hypothetical protein WAX38_05110 [Minisyncoccia bacterium]